MSREITQPQEAEADRARLLEEQAALRRVATLVANGVEPGPLFDALAGEIEALLGADISAVLRFEGDGTVTVMGANRGPHSRGARVNLDPDYVVGVVYRTGQSASFDLQEWDGEPPAVAREWGVRSALATPVIVDGELWGAFTIASLERSLATGTDRRLADFSALFATAIANAQSREALAALAEEQAALRRVATLVANDVSPNEIFSAVSEEVARLFDSAAGVGRFEHDPAVVYVGVVNIDIPIGSRWEFQDGMISTEVYRTGHPARVEEADWSSLEGELGEQVRRHGFRSMVGSPIFVEGSLWGTIVVSSQDLLPHDTEERLEKFTELIATAIANAATRQTREQLAEEQAALRRVATLVAESAEPEAVFSAVAEEVAHVLNVALSAVVRYEADNAATQVGSWGWGNKNPFPVGTSWKLDENSVSGRVAATRLPARVANYAQVSGPIAAAVTRDVGIQSAVGAPILVGGHLWGVMMALSTEEKHLPDDAETRLAAFTELVATAISNTTARTELIESRARIVAAGDEARRRIERNLHDGTQQRLIALGLDIQRVRTTIPQDQHDTHLELQRLEQDLETVLEDLRELSRGLHPPLLARRGLGSSLRALARDSPIPVELEIDLPERPPAPLEIAVYYVVSEALTNAIKHSQASAISITVETDHADGPFGVGLDGRGRGFKLHATIADDGVGGADASVGSGLTGLADRVEALGGRFALDTPSGGGTRISIELPLETR